MITVQSDFRISNHYCITSCGFELKLKGFLCVQIKLIYIHNSSPSTGLMEDPSSFVCEDLHGFTILLCDIVCTCIAVLPECGSVVRNRFLLTRSRGDANAIYTSNKKHLKM